jgi:hypothetical protein
MNLKEVEKIDDNIFRCSAYLTDRFIKVKVNGKEISVF